MASKDLKSTLKLWFAFSGMLFLYCLPFNLIGLIFTASDGMSGTIQLIVGILFMLPVCVIFYHVGSSRADREFSARNRMVLAGKGCTRIPFSYCFTETVVFMILPVLLAVLGNLTGVIVLQSIPLYVFCPMAICFVGLDVLSFTALSWNAVIAVVVFEVIVLTLYYIAYVRKEKQRALDTKEITNEVFHNDRITRV